jgi:hypothetical protein
MSEDETPDAVELANRAAEAIRQLHHATGRGQAGRSPGPRYPSDVCGILGALTLATHRLPQALQQLAGFLEAEAAASRVKSDSQPATVEGSVAKARSGISRASAYDERLASNLDAAQSATTWLAHRPPMSATHRNPSQDVSRARRRR